MPSTRSTRIDESQFVRIADASDVHAKQLRRIYQRIGWKTRDWSGSVWATPDKRGSIEVQTSAKATDNLSEFIDTVLHSSAVQYRSDLAPKEINFGKGYFTSLRDKFDELPLWKLFHHVNLPLLANPSEMSFEFLAHEFLPWFFAKFPKGRVDFVAPTGPFWPQMHAVRKLFQIDQNPAVALKNPGPPATLAQLHGFDTLYLPTDEISIWCSQTWPFVTAVPMPISTCCFVLHLGETWDVREASPSSVERWWRNELLFSSKDDDGATLRRIMRRESPPTPFDDIGEVIHELTSPEAFGYYLSRISRLRAMISDFRIGASAQTRSPSYATNLQLLLTLQRIVASTHYLTSYEPPFLAKSLLFDVADEYAAMAEPREDQQAGFFEWLFDPSLGGSWVAEALGRIPGSGGYWAAKSTWLYNQVDQSVGAGVEGPPTTSNSHLIRILRNARHGYWLRGDDLTRHLSNYDANLKDFAPALSVLWWFAFLEEPWQLLRRDIDPLLVHSYSRPSS
jgi:hypothetical protein